MKRTTKYMLVIAAAAGTLAGNSWGAIAGSQHDFSSKGWAKGEICLPCHAPHNNRQSAVVVLWNHQDTTASYTMYSSGSMDATVPTGPSAGSRTCLSCHDGTVALDSFGGNTGTNFLSASSASYLSQDLSNDHPISFDYTKKVADDDRFLKDPTTASSGLGSTIADDMLIAGKVECSSCHDVHNQYNVTKLLKKSNVGSALCTTCHSK